MSLSNNHNMNMDTQMSGTSSGQIPALIAGNNAPAAASVVQQPKVQTAFIHKLYNMLEDSNIQHLISWSPTNESFVVSPTQEFSKVLSQYFKHTNISSFVRQLNMYGFHKVNDVFHTGSPDSTMWEFKHGNGSFKRGDLVGLRDIKRRASRHALIHRDSFSGPKVAPVSTPGTPSELPPDSTEARLISVEQTLYDVTTRLARAEDTNMFLVNRCHSAMEGLMKCHQWTNDLSQFVMSIVPPQEPVVRELHSLQREIERHTHLLDESQELMRERPPFQSSLSDNTTPLSPRQRPVEDDSRRSSLSGQLRPGGYFRPPAPPQIANPPRRFGSSSFMGATSPNLRPQQITQQPPSLPIAGSYPQPPSHLSRRHTSADIRTHGWQANPNSPFAPPGLSHVGPQWPPSPSRNMPKEASSLRESMSNYDIQQPRRQSQSTLYPAQTTPPLSEGNTSGTESGWNFGGPRFPPPREAGHTAPPTRRSSLASSSVHALLNPPDSGLDRDGYSDGEPDDRKRKRLM